jgi:hypothetical protein
MKLKVTVYDMKRLRIHFWDFVHAHLCSSIFYVTLGKFVSFFVTPFPYAKLK